MASIGIDLLTVQLLGRWGSDAVLRYVADVPLSALTRRVVEKYHTADLEEIVSRIAGRGPANAREEGAGEGLSSLGGELQSLRTELGVTQESFRFLAARVDLAHQAAAATPERKPVLVLNLASMILHRSLGRAGHPTG